MAFEKTLLATGEIRGEYIARRLGEGATVQQVLAEINAPGMYSGTGSGWGATVVYAEKKKLDAKATKAKTVPDVARRAAPPVELVEDEAPEAELDTHKLEVPAEYEDILTAEDMADVRAEAAKGLRDKQRKAAKKDMLARATQELEREAMLLAQTDLRGDHVSVTIDLAPFAPFIKLDGRLYEHGRTYAVPRKIFNTLNEQMFRTWQHEGTLHGESDNAYRRSSMQRGRSANTAASLRGTWA